MDEYTESLKAANEQLMTCPFCGHSAVIREHRFYSEKSYGVICSDCGAMSFQFFPTMGEAVAAWNTRVADDKPVARGEWIWEENEWRYRCSACRITFDYDKTYELFDHGYQYANFCPNCGMPMTEEALKILARRDGERSG